MALSTARALLRLDPTARFASAVVRRFADKAEPVAAKEAPKADSEEPKAAEPAEEAAKEK